MRIVSCALTLALLLSVAGCSSTPDASAEGAAASTSMVDGFDLTPAEPAEGHVWLQQLVGTWEVNSQADMGADQGPIGMEARESIRAVGQLWIYDGELDETGSSLHLYADGPDFADPTMTRRYRDSTTILAPGHRRGTSAVMEEAGSWTVFMRGEARRVGE